jgi:signal transduction histidine kinase
MTHRPGSLRARLLRLATLTIGIGLALAWVAFTTVFERHLERRAAAELAYEIVQMAALVDASGPEISLSAALPDPRFQRPFSGRYWQVETAGEEPVRSRSLWDETLPPPPSTDDVPQVYGALGPKGRQLLLRAETLTFAGPDGERKVRLVVADDRMEIEGAVADYGRDLAVALAIVGFCLALASGVQVRIGLAPLGALRQGLAAIRTGRRRRIDADVPSEVSPLVEELNELLAAQDAALARARAQADDLAHGLKTPLTVLAAVSHTLDRFGRGEEATEIVSQVEMMRRRIDRQLAKARLGAGSPTACRPAELVDKLVAVMQRTPRGAQLAWSHARLDESMAVADEVDAAEAIGNILDNACKWARTSVAITTAPSAGYVVVRVEDDGPGVPADRLQNVLARGARLDEEAEGCGLGLAITQDIVSAYGGDVTLDRSPAGGLRAAMRWPAARPHAKTRSVA